MTPLQKAALLHVAQKGAQRPSEVGEAIGIKHNLGVWNIMHPLESAGLIFRVKESRFAVYIPTEGAYRWEATQAGMTAASDLLKMEKLNDEDPLAGLDFEIEEPTDVVDLTNLEDHELSTLWGAVREELYALGEMLAPADQRTERGKELHSQFIAIQVEKNRRGW